MSWQFLGANTLIWQPDTRVQAFATGLVLVQRSAVCRNTYLTTARGSITVGAVLPCQSPSTVTVFQFPQAQEISEGNGFVRFDVSGYGIAGDGVFRNSVVNPNGGNSFPLSTTFVCPSVFRQFVIPTQTIYDFISLLPTINPVTLARRNGVVCTVNDHPNNRWVLVRGEVLQEYGSYAEVEIDYRFTVTSSQMTCP
jgi:hypothetical protein